MLPVVLFTKSMCRRFLQNHNPFFRQKHLQEETEEVFHPKSSKRPKVEPIREDETPKKKKKMQKHADLEENSSKENQPPKAKKEKKRELQAEDQSGVADDQSAAILDDADTSALSNGGKKKRKKKAVKCEEAAENVSQDVPAKKTSKTFFLLS